jgi:hypothetical protein
MAYDPLNPDHDPFGPPAIPTLVHCIHCDNEFDSYRIEWRVEYDVNGHEHGFWCCPMPGCDGKGFGFDIFPVDPEYRDENGELMWCSDEGDEFEEDDVVCEDDEDLALGDEFTDDLPDWIEDGETPFRGSRKDRDDDLPF